MERIGVFLCHCSLIVPIDIERALQAISKQPGVVYAASHQDLCTDPGLAIVKDTIEREKLDGVVLSTCSPSLHGEVFRDILTGVGLGAHQREVADLRGGDGWPHALEEATQRTIEVINASLERLRSKVPTTSAKVPVTKRALVVGGGWPGFGQHWTSLTAAMR